jgi:hypothetical protein
MICDEGIVRYEMRIEEARHILVQFDSPVSGGDEPPDAASDDEEIQAFREDMTGLLSDIEE